MSLSSAVQIYRHLSITRTEYHPQDNDFLSVLELAARNLIAYEEIEYLTQAVAHDAGISTAELNNIIARVNASRE